MTATHAPALLAAPAPRAFRPYAPAPLPGTPSLARLLWILYRNPLETWTEEHFREPFVSRENRLGRSIVVSDPAAIRRVLIEHAANYPKDLLQRRVLAPGLGDGLLTAEGETWRRARRTLAPLFTPRRTDSLAARMRRIAAARVDRWLARRPGAILDVDREMQRVTFDILSATLFSDAIAGQAGEFEREMDRYLDAVGRIDPLDLLGAPSWVPRLGRIRARASLDFFERRVTEIVAARRALIERNPEAAPDDLLTALLRAADPETGAGLTEVEAGANIITFITAGHETTARALAWTLHLLGRAPAARAEVEREAREAASSDDPAEWIDRLPWTRAVLEEAMRLFPTVPFLSRTPIEPDDLGGRRVTPGTLVVIAPYVLHRHRTLWDSPDRFMPERFLPGARESVDRFAYLPFGAGPRVCIGSRFALQEAMIVLVEVMARVRLEPVEGPEPRPVHRITLRPEGRLAMGVWPRG